MVTKKDFKCKQCGECCKLIVKLSKKDIERIEKVGYGKEEFAALDPLEPRSKVKDAMKRRNSRCVFSDLKENKYWCRIYKIRPRNCRIFPFFNDDVESCKPDRLLKWW
jgi:Fe-S-cluster containining protein|tara:strand:- start:79 stop:402 length:324 start_codon:yes stop_codon:yes gene_type:complete